MKVKADIDSCYFKYEKGTPQPANKRRYLQDGLQEGVYGGSKFEELHGKNRRSH